MPGLLSVRLASRREGSAPFEGRSKSAGSRERLWTRSCSEPAQPAQNCSEWGLALLGEVESEKQRIKGPETPSMGCCRNRLTEERPCSVYNRKGNGVSNQVIKGRTYV